MNLKYKKENKEKIKINLNIPEVKKGKWFNTAKTNKWLYKIITK